VDGWLTGCKPGDGDDGRGRGARCQDLARVITVSPSGFIVSRTVLHFCYYFFSRVLSPFQNVVRFDFFRFIYFTIYLDICYIYVHDIINNKAFYLCA